jgi:hypothetical protein
MDVKCPDWGNIPSYIYQFLGDDSNQYRINNGMSDQPKIISRPKHDDCKIILTFFNEEYAMIFRLKYL